MNGIFDSHAHYDDERFDADRDELLESIHREGVGIYYDHRGRSATELRRARTGGTVRLCVLCRRDSPEQAGDAPKTIWKS